MDKWGGGVHEPNSDETDNLAPARGILTWVLIAISMWLVVAVLVSRFKL